jgi:hypothetical protein
MVIPDTKTLLKSAWISSQLNYAWAAMNNRRINQEFFNHKSGACCMQNVGAHLPTVHMQILNVIMCIDNMQTPYICKKVKN